MRASNSSRVDQKNPSGGGHVPASTIRGLGNPSRGDEVSRLLLHRASDRIAGRTALREGHE
jgi:hypothetical protein